VKDNPLNTAHAAVSAVLTGGCSITGSAVGVLVDGPAASAQPGDAALAPIAGNYITLTNGSSADVNATSVQFDTKLGSAMSQAELFATEDKIQHKVDNAALGLVRVKALNLYVTTSSGAQRCNIIAASATPSSHITRR